MDVGFLIEAIESLKQQEGETNIVSINIMDGQVKIIYTVDDYYLQSFVY